MTKILVVSGFLGAGKTTLIQHLLQTALRNKRVLIIENDFGRVEIDEALLKSYPIQIENLNAGCIFCSLRENFQQVLERALTHAPDYILVEPSGAAHLSEVLEVVLKFENQGKAVFVKAISVLDARRFLEYRKYYRTLLDDQVEYADLILLSHQQNINPIAKMQLSRLLRSQNPDAELRPETWNRIPNAVFLRGLRGSQTLMLDLQTNVLPSPLSHSHGENRQGFLHRMLLRWELSAVTLRCEKCYTPTELSRRVEQITSATGQTVLRGKGIVRSKRRSTYTSSGTLYLFLRLNNSETFVELVGARPLHLLSQTVLPLKSPTGAFIAPLRKCALLKTRHFRQCARKNEGNFGKKRDGRTVPALLTRKNTRLFIIIKL